MASRLIVIHGPPAVGKTAVAGALFRRLERAAWLDGDDVWRIRPFEVSERTRAIVEANVPTVLRSYLEAGYPDVLFSWVLHARELIERTLAPIADLEPELHVFTLVCTREALRHRLRADPDRETDPALALRRLDQARELGTFQIDTTDVSAKAVASAILRILDR
jgi:predicted kinase